MHDSVMILFGGTFDPIHKGHLAVAQAAVEQLDTERLIFVPAHRSPHKTDTSASGCHRLEMIRRAIVGCDRLDVSDCELERTGPSYTLDTVRHFQRRFDGGVDLVWLIGADQLASLEQWYRIDELLEACRIAVMHRGGCPPPDFERFKGIFTEPQLAALKENVMATPLVDISSTDIRRRLAAGDSCPDVLPDPVVRYIRTHHLYGFMV